MRPYQSPTPYWGSGPLSGIYRCKDGKCLYLSSTYSDPDSRRYMRCVEALGICLRTSIGVDLYAFSRGVRPRMGRSGH